LSSDTATIVQRNLITVRRVPQLLVFATIQPIIFVLMFRYVFGGAIPLPGVDDVDYLMPGIFTQTVAFGFLVGFRIHNGFPKFILAIVVLLGLGFALSWLFGLIGLIMKNAETTQAAAFPIMAPLVFASNAFVNPATMASWLQGWVRNQPLSVVISTVRRLTLDGVQVAAVGITQSTTHLSFLSAAWISGLSLFFGFLAVRKYRQAA